MPDYLARFKRLQDVAQGIPAKYAGTISNRANWVKASIGEEVLDEPCCDEGKTSNILPPKFAKLDISLSNRCNLSCEFCYTKGGPKNGPDIFRTIKHVDWFLKNSEPNPKITIFGGEPLVEHSDLLALDDWLKEKGQPYRLGIVTNLTLLNDKVLGELVKRRIEISPSMDGCPEAQDYHRRFTNGLVGSSPIVEQNAKRLLAQRPNVKCRMTVTPETALLLQKSIAYLAGLGFTTINAILAGGATWTERQIQVLKEQVYRTTDWWIAQMIAGKHISLYYLRNMFKGMFQTRPYVGICQAATSEIAIDTEGRLWPCNRFAGHCDKPEFCLGNIEVGVINHRVRRAFATCNLRESLHAQCGQCRAKPSCHSICIHELMSAGNLTLDGDKLLMNPLPITCEMWPFYWNEAVRAAETLKDNPLFLSQYKPVTTLEPARQPSIDVKGIAQDRLLSEYEILPPISAQAPENMLVSVVIASRDEGQELLETIKSAKAAAQGQRLEIVVVDDASKVSVLESVKATDSDVLVIRNATPLGPGRSRQIGISASTGRVVALVDSHERFPLGLWHKCAKIAVERRAIVNPGVEAMLGGVQGFGTRLTWHRDHKIGIDYERTPTQDLECRTGLIGACYFLPREIIDQLGGWVCQLGLWGHEEEAAGAWAWLHDVPILTTSDVVKHLYRSEKNMGNLPVPWGGPSTSGIYANVFSTYRRLFEPETFEAVFAKSPHYQVFKKIPALQEADSRANLSGSDTWRKTKTKTDYEFFRDCIKRPAFANPNGSVNRLAKIAIIMCACNEGEEVQNTLVSIVNSCNDHHEIIAVDDHSTDGSFDNIIERVRVHVYEHWKTNLPNRLKVIRNEQKIGVPQSRRKAIALSDADVFIFFDGHMRVPTIYGIETLCCQALEKQAILMPAVAGLGKGNDESAIRTYGAHWQITPKWGLLNAHINEKPKQRFNRIETIIGACYAMPRTVLDKLGGWPDLPGHWAYDEQEIGLRAYLYDIPMYCDASVVVEHFYKTKFNYPLDHSGVVLNGHRTFALHFPETYKDFWRPLLMPHGYFPIVDEYLSNGRYATELAEVQNKRQHSEQHWFESIGVKEWPPTPTNYLQR